MLTLLDDLAARSITPRIEFTGPDRLSGTASFTEAGRVVARIEFRRSAAGEIREMTICDPQGSLRIVAGQDAFSREPLLARWARQLAADTRR